MLLPPPKQRQRFLPAIKRKTAPSLVVPGAVVLDYVDING
jgi:hypothetical protein